MNIKFQSKTYSGFTLIELIVTLFILSLVFAGGWFVSFDREKYHLENSITIFSSHLRETRDKTLNRVIDPTCQKWYPDNEHCDQYEIHLSFKEDTQKYIILPIAEKEMNFQHLSSYPIFTLQPGTEFIDPINEGVIQFLYIPNDVIQVTPSYQSGNETLICDGSKTVLKNFTLASSLNLDRKKNISLLCNSDILLSL